MLIVTLIYSIFSILGIGSFLGPILTKLNVMKQAQPEINTDILEVEKRKGSRKLCHDFKRILGRFDEHYFSPLFIK
jgi:hypothetical protein